MLVISKNNHITKYYNLVAYTMATRHQMTRLTRMTAHTPEHLVLGHARDIGYADGLIAAYVLLDGVVSNKKLEELNHAIAESQENI